MKKIHKLMFAISMFAKILLCSIAAMDKSPMALPANQKIGIKEKHGSVDASTQTDQTNPLVIYNAREESLQIISGNLKIIVKAKNEDILLHKFTNPSTGALISPVNTRYGSDGGVSSKILDKAGEPLKAYMKRFGRWEWENINIIPSYRLRPAAVTQGKDNGSLAPLTIIHVVAPTSKDQLKDDHPWEAHLPRNLQDVYTVALDAAFKHNISELVFPLIGTGGGRKTAKQSIDAALAAFEAYATSPRAHSSLCKKMTITFACYGGFGLEDIYHAFKAEDNSEEL